ncbi:MAG: transporter [Chitinophagaceae bacterium]|nr:transporter [Chitinophagaceae bacterium]
MKKCIVLLCFSLVSLSVLACDICGSGAGGGYMGLLPGFRKRFISFRYSQNSLLSHLGSGGSSTYLTTKENFQLLELWGAVNLGKRFRIAGFVPVNFMQRENGLGHFKQNGLGDISLVGYYQMLNSDKELKKSNRLLQSLWLGAGIKAPSGRYNPEEKNVQEGSQNTFQLGTGSLDYSLHMMYDISLNNLGLNTNIGYRINSANKYDYRYGNKLTANVLAYYKWQLNDGYAISPNAGILYESSSKDHKTSGISVWETGGRSTMGTLGLEVALGRIGLGMNYQTPLTQHLGEGKLKAGDRGMAYLSFSF